MSARTGMRGSPPLSFGDWLRRQTHRRCGLGIHSWVQAEDHCHYHQCARCGALRLKHEGGEGA